MWIGLHPVADAGKPRSVVLTRISHQFGDVLTLELRDGHHAVVRDVDHFHAVEVDHSRQALHWTGVGMTVLDRRADPGQCPAHTAVTGVRVGQPGAGPGIDVGERQVGDAATAHRLPPSRVGRDGFGHGENLLEEVGRPRPGDRLAAHHVSTGEGHDRLVKLSAGPVVDDCEGLAVQARRAVPSQHLRLGWLLQGDRDEA